VRLEVFHDQVYQIEASSDLLNWAKIGQATAGVDGRFDFVDGDRNRFASRYYRAGL
jgi:hypothetical protein